MNGYINIDKPQGMTSFAVVHRVRKLLGVKRVGHAGTLDPNATGVLPVLVGKGTKAMAYLDDEMKTYRAEMVFGKAYDTEDIWGKVVDRAPYTFDPEAIERVLKASVGEIWQVPPMYSALKKNGQKLVDLARQGIEVEREPRRREIYAIEEIRFDERAESVTFDVTCSRGTYIRTLCADMGRQLGTLAAMSSLRRLQSHVCRLEDAWRLAPIEEAICSGEQNFLRPLEELFSHLDAIETPEALDKPLTNGVKIDLTPYAKTTKQLYRLYSGRRFLGLAAPKKDGIYIEKLMIG